MRISEERGCQLSDLTLADLKTLSDAFEDDVAKVWSMDESVERRDATGGTSKRAVMEQCDRLEAIVHQQTDGTSKRLRTE